MFQTIYLKKWTDNFSSQEVIDIAIEQWRKALAGVKSEHIEKAIEHCRDNLIWPPSIAEFLTFCEREEGIPNEDDAFKQAIRREYTHEIVRIIVFDIGSWSMQNDIEKVLRKKFKDAYQKRLEEYRKLIKLRRIE